MSMNQVKPFGEEIEDENNRDPNNLNFHLQVTFKKIFENQNS